jgi:hypothetical protein
MLRTAVRDNPHLKPMMTGGEFRDRYRFAWYESGRMMYLRKPDLKNANDDLRSFIAWALEGARDYPPKAR